jgi:hypothetical protein
VCSLFADRACPALSLVPMVCAVGGELAGFCALFFCAYQLAFLFYLAPMMPNKDRYPHPNEAQAGPYLVATAYVSSPSIPSLGLRRSSLITFCMMFDWRAAAPVHCPLHAEAVRRWRRQRAWRKPRAAGAAALDVGPGATGPRLVIHNVILLVCAALQVEGDEREGQYAQAPDGGPAPPRFHVETE